MSRRPLAILYENSRSADGHFTPHVFLMACVADELPGISWSWSLASLVLPIPKKGVAALLAAINDADLLLNTYERLLVVVDDDHVREHARLPEDAAASTVTVALAARSGRPNDVEVFLLEKNLEALVVAAARALGLPTNPRKDHLTRDKLLMRAARAEAATVRRAIRNEVPSFDRIVVRAIAVVQAALP